MTDRIQITSAKYSDVLRAMLGLSAAYEKSIEHSLVYLVQMRASQLNGCGYCIDMHSKDARLEGETEQRLYLLDAWREAPLYSARERAALEWTEAVTMIKEHRTTDELYQRVREHFSEEELVKLTLAIVAINGWNRLSISFASTPGTYKAGSVRQLRA